MEHSDPLALVRPHEVHRDLYRCPRVFELEMQRLWARTWLYVGHDSQVPEPGDHVALNLGAQPVLMVRRDDGGIVVLHNRCAHRGAPLVPEGPGRAQRLLRCPYHGWAYRFDGRLAGLPQRAGYDGVDFEASTAAARGLTPYGEVAVHRGFVFARARADGPGFEAALGELLGALDLICDRSPRGRLRVAGGVLRSVVRANWKLYLENINDAVHPPSTHASVTDAAGAAWKAEAAAAGAGVGPNAEAPPLAMRQLLPFGSGFEFFDRMGARLLPHGHSILGTQHSIHSGYSAQDAQALRDAHGEQRAGQVLAFAPQNVVFYPSMALKGSPQVMRVLRPLAPDRTLVEAWAFEPEGAGPQALQGALLYNRQVFSPLSMVAHDDLHLFEGQQRSLAADGNPWVSLHRGARPGVDQAPPCDVGGLDEGLLRNQYRAWLDMMRPVVPGTSGADLASAPRTAP
jgi:phenylpropionate dioxygenase-like ring-hydroxylating dioxygenase large terminal subunit